MTKKDYKIMARYFAELHTRQTDFRISLVSLMRIQTLFCTYCRIDNPNFNEDIFRATVYELTQRDAVS